MTPWLDHVSVTTADLARSVAFYRDVVGLPLLGSGEAAEPELSTLLGMEDVRLRWAELDLGGGQILELIEYVTPTGEPLDVRANRPGAGHIGLAVEDFDAVHSRLVEAGAMTSERPVVLTEDGDWKGTRSLYARDPDGVAIEVVARQGRVVRIPDLDAVQRRRG
jgi:catechol 2,3-dioxygenase-like lactoylglutathione lyase family enzyme